MRVLSVDSSSKCATCAILDENGVIAECTLNNKREHSVLLMPMIENLLKDSNLTINDIDGYVVSKGPGSFTGLRIGMATIKGLSFGGNKPYVSISSLDGLAHAVSPFDGIICSVMEALRENVYAAMYKMVDGKLQTILEPTSIDIDKLMELVKEKDENIIFTGDGVLKHKEYMEKEYPKASFAPNYLNLIRASSIGELGLEMLKAGIKDDENSSPLYLKQPQAVRELNKRLELKNGESNS